MLKNRKEREQYIQSEENWIEIGAINNVVRLLKLNKTNVYRVEEKHFNNYCGESWRSQFGYLVIEDFEKGISRTLTKTEMIDYLKDLEEWCS